MFLATHGILRSIVGGVPTLANNYSIELDGLSDYVTFGNMSSFSGATQFTFSGWYKMNVKPATDGLLDVHIDNNNFFNILPFSNGVMYIQFKVGGTLSFAQISYNSLITQGQYFHIAVAYDGSQSTNSTKLKVYINNVNILFGQSGTFPSSLAIGTNDVRIGSLQYTNALLDGNVDECAVFNTQLSAIDVSNLYNSGIPPDISNMNNITNLWRMGDGDTAPTITDNIGSNDGTMMDFSTFSTDVPFNYKSMNFDGINDYFTGVGTYSELNAQNKMTLSLWMKPISGAPLYEYVVTVPRNTTANEHVFSFQHFENNYLSFSIDSRLGKSVQAGISSITYGSWNHILCVLDGTLSGDDRMKIYVNGVDESYQVNIGTFTSLQNSTGALFIGEEPQGAYNPYKGLLDEVAIWSGADLRNDVSTIYNNGTPTDLNNNGLTAPTTWLRMGDNASWDGTKWTMTDVNSSYQLESSSMVEADRTTDVP